MVVFLLDVGNLLNDPDIKIILNKPFNYNRIVSLKRLFSENKKDFAMGKMENRECVLINRIGGINE